MHGTAKYCITFTPKCFAPAVAAVTVVLEAILPNKKGAKFYNFCAALLILRTTANSANVGQFCACRIAEF